MATRVRTRGSDLYEQDFYVWAREQATLLRAGRYDELDLEHLTEEVEDLGGSFYRSVRSRVRTIIEHLLKLEHSPSREPRQQWMISVNNARGEIGRRLTPTIRGHVEPALPDLYRRSRRNAELSLFDHKEPDAARAFVR